MADLESRTIMNYMKQQVLRKFYGGERKPYMHDFSLDDGVCKHCGEFIGDAKSRLCNTITSDEVALFRDYDER